MDQNWNEWFDQTYKKMYPIMYRTAYRLTGSAEKAEELVHDAFSLALSRQDTLISHPNPEGWLMKTLTNLAKMIEKGCHQRKSLWTHSLYISRLRRTRPTFGNGCRRTCLKRTCRF